MIMSMSSRMRHCPDLQVSNGHSARHAVTCAASERRLWQWLPHGWLTDDMLWAMPWLASEMPTRPAVKHSIAALLAAVIDDCVQ